MLPATRTGDHFSTAILLCFCNQSIRNAAPAASSASNSVVLNRAFLTPYSQIQTLQNWLADVLKQCPDWASIFRYCSGKEEEQLEQQQMLKARAEQYVQDLVSGRLIALALRVVVVCLAHKQPHKTLIRIVIISSFRLDSLCSAAAPHALPHHPNFSRPSRRFFGVRGTISHIKTKITLLQSAVAPSASHPASYIRSTPPAAAARSSSCAMQLSIAPCSPWQRRPCSCAGLTRARFSRQLRSPVRLIVCLDSGRLDALYPYCVEAGGATHLDALMVMLVLWQPPCRLIMS